MELPRPEERTRFISARDTNNPPIKNLKKTQKVRKHCFFTDTFMTNPTRHRRSHRDIRRAGRPSAAGRRGRAVAGQCQRHAEVESQITLGNEAYAVLNAGTGGVSVRGYLGECCSTDRLLCHRISGNFACGTRQESLSKSEPAPQSSPFVQCICVQSVNC